MDLGWLRDYGAFIAASIAAVAAVASTSLQLRHARQFGEKQWFRAARMDRYGPFVAAFYEYRSAILWTYCEADSTILGPPPPDVQPESARQKFQQALGAVALVGPPAVTTAAREIQRECWSYRNQLENDPFNFDQKASDRAIAQFLKAAQDALGLPPGKQSEHEPSQH